MKQGNYESHALYGTRLLPFIHRDDTVSRTVCHFKPHWHENIELLHCKEGEGHVLINGADFSFKKGDVAVINPNEIHFVTSKSFVRYDCIIIFASFLEENGLDLDKYTFNSVIKDEKLSLLHEVLCENFKAKAIDPLKTRLNALELLYLLKGDFSSSVALPSDNSLKGIKRAIKYINRNYSENLTLDAVAKISNMSKYYFTKKFKEIVGKSFIDYLNSLRCSKAAKELGLNKSISEVCFLVGFNDPAYFSRVFKKTMGVTPSKYR